ncbi:MULTISPECIES: SRPBCC family protein [unclassified Sphingopyxis]|uniref:SRPBCC family protein n=1 Tax=unclassified Sphingopyxis TaxID=2614943 RepID=UPI0007379218|nr:MULTISPECIES: SRPBCC family protein [unclassified Sphingopyxis]KTE31752.1 hypothetical protein ATE62_19390 [Sphingopyxis sp. HIX]KTE79108.1 hypothetical protein ATE72_19335 [Sphingopyxis sp. HXXIV]
MTESRIHHASFSVERGYRSPRERVWAAFTDAASRRRWLVESDGWTVHAYDPPREVKPGAVETSRFSPPGADIEITNDTTYLDVEPAARLIFAYAMTMGGAPLSSSLSTVEFFDEGAGTRLVLTEQGAYHDGNVAGREEGTRELFEALAKELAEA